MEGDDFQTLLAGISSGKSTVIDVCRNYNKQDAPPTLTDGQFKEQPFFTNYFSKQLCEILECWISDGSINDNQAEIFHECSTFLYQLTKRQGNSKQWLNEQTALIDLVVKCLNEIASYGYYIGIGGSEDPCLDSFDWLIQAFENVQCPKLLDILVKCITCRFYLEALYRLSEVDALSLTITQHFLLVTCPSYILTCDVKKTHCLKIVNQMLEQYKDIYAEFLPHIKQWTIPVILSLIYPIKFILFTIRSLAFEQRKVIYEIILTILLNKSTTDPNIEQVRVTLIYTSLCLLIEIIRSDQRLANQLKNITDKKTELINVLNDLAKNEKNSKIQLKAVDLKSLLMPEEEFLQENSTQELTSLFVKNFNDALEDGTNEQVDEILNGLKDLVQNDEVKQEIIKQNGLPSIIKYAKETKDDPLPLEITYAMTFNGDARKVINQDTEFVDHIKQLRTSEKRDVSKIAHGIVWKLEGEEKLKSEREEKAKSSDARSESSEKETNKYDIMISYCWAQKPVCHRINDRLEKDGLKVWLDRDEMHGSIIERMAEAIENSRFVLICMSSNYKNSTNCKAEAEYAFNRKSKIIPLLVEPKYKADGWLGFLAGSKIYVDFADKEEEDEEFEKAYGLLIGELKGNGLDDVDEDEQAKTTPATTTESEKVKEEPGPPPVQTREYLNVGPASMWTSEHVMEFLFDNQLDQLKYVCESMDGETLIEFCHSCQTIPDKMYGLVNNHRDEQPVSVSTFFKFICKLKKYLPPQQPKKVHFQYNLIYPPKNTTKEVIKDNGVSG